MLSPARTLLPLLFGIALALTGGCSKKPAAAASTPGGNRQPVEVTAVLRRDLAETLSVVGSLAPNESAEIRAELSGQVRAVSFEEGQPVAPGQVLLKLDDAELRAQLAQAEARFELAAQNLQRTTNLAEAKSLSRAEVDRVRSEHAATEAELRYLRVRLDKLDIKAPFAGMAGARTVSPGDYITAATVVTTIDDLSRLKIEFQVPERYAAQIKPGSVFTMRARTPQAEIKMDGEVYFVSAVIDRATRSSQVKGYLRSPAEGLKPGMFANVDLVLQVRAGVLTVPEGALLVTPAGTQIVLVREKNGEHVAEFVTVRTGLREKGLVEVSAEPGQLSESDRVVASGVGALALFAGMKLEPRPLREEFRIGG